MEEYCSKKYLTFEILSSLLAFNCINCQVKSVDFLKFTKNADFDEKAAFKN